MFLTPKHLSPIHRDFLFSGLTCNYLGYFLLSLKQNKQLPKPESHEVFCGFSQGKLKQVSIGGLTRPLHLDTAQGHMATQTAAPLDQ